MYEREDLDNKGRRNMNATSCPVGGGLLSVHIEIT